MGRQLHRPTKLRVPEPILRTTLREASNELLGSLRVVPGRLQSAGFAFRHRTADDVVAAGLG
jgi:uncharacterized protein